ncbi:hypothetical protein JCM14202_3669 [Agrilactobacillus composti DSM 18527 = JCM 14202]|nr:hypothetical protein JCM14202_3669 [Agrilactobacillus composti DSM 18527 = JCM 14202]
MVKIVKDEAKLFGYEAVTDDKAMQDLTTYSFGRNEQLVFDLGTIMWGNSVLI